jgi:uncharacterized membrane protein required for colicin V production
MALLAINGFPNNWDWVDIGFVVTVVLLVLNGLKNGAVFSLINILSIPVAFLVTYLFGPRFVAVLAVNGFSATPLIAYGVLFLGTVLILHIVGSVVRKVLKYVPLLGPADSLLGGALGFVESWLLWLLLLFVLGTFLSSVQSGIETGSIFSQGIDLQVLHMGNIAQFLPTFQQWHDFYNQAVTNSLFAKVNSFFVTALPELQIKTPLPLQS